MSGPTLDAKDPEKQDTGFHARMHAARRDELANKLMGFTNKDGTFLQKLGACVQHFQVKQPAVSVTYQNLTVTTKALVGSAAIPTVGNVAVDCFKAWTGMGKGRAEQDLNILDHVHGVLKPGRLTLLLGPPSCGKTTLLKVLSGRLKKVNMQVEGSVLYNNVPLDQFHVQRTAAFVDQVDNHNGYLSVAETLLFAFCCQVGLHGMQFDLPAEIMRAKDAASGNGQAAGNLSPDTKPGSHRTSSDDFSSKEDNATFAQAAATVYGSVAEWIQMLDVLKQTWGTEVRVAIVMRLLGLSHCQATLVGDQMIRGISGGEKKRLSTAEMIVGSRNIMFLDEISTGLDSATLYTIIKWLRESCHAFRQTTMISLLQPPPETFQLFDDVVMITEGRIIYHGPVKDVMSFFNTLGFECPQRKDIPSFLLEVTTPTGQYQYATPELLSQRNASRSYDASRSSSKEEQRQRLQEQQRQPLPRSMLVSVDEMCEAFWKRNEHGVAMMADLAASSQDPRTREGFGLFQRPYALSPLEAIGITIQRQLVLLLRDRVLLRGRLAQTLVISLISGSLFYKLPITLEGSRSYFGACFMSVLFLAFGGFPQLPTTIQMKSVFYKHRDNYFIPAYAQAIAISFVQLPLTVLECGIFSLVMYFMIGFYRGPGYFFTFYVVAMGVSLSVSSIFRFLGCVCPNMVIANAFGGLSLVLLIVTSGFVIIRSSIPPWMIWAYYISPFSYGLRALVINEMTSPQWQIPTPGDPGTPLGVTALKSFGFFQERFWIWAGVGFLLGLYLLLTAACSLSLALQDPEVPRAQLPDEKEIEAARAKAAAQRQKLLLRQTTSLKRSKLAMMLSSVKATSPRGPTSPTPASALALETSRTPHDPPDTPTPTSPPPHTHTTPAAGGGSTGTPVVVLPQDGGGELRQVLTSRREEEGARGVLDDAGAGMNIASSLPFQRVSLAFRDLRYSVANPAYSRRVAKAAASKSSSRPGTPSLSPAPSADTHPPKALAASPEDPRAKEHLDLLQGVTGYAEPNVLTALMGGSGAGKTTLMDVIAGRKTVGHIHGDIFVNGHPKQQHSWSRVVGYCEQFDLHSPAQTVQEALMFSARLRLPSSVTNEQVTAYVNDVLDIVDMIDLQYNLVGMPAVNGLSVEQRKRLTIAVELVSNPSVVFMDEPTSGLDARAASTVMRAVRNVALNGRTVMVTIHQPSIEIFEAFDMLLLIQRGGRVTYFGPLGTNSDTLITYLCQIPSTPPLPPGYNPATWMLEVTGGSMATMVQAVDVDWPSVYQASDLCERNKQYVDHVVERDTGKYAPLEVPSMYAQSFAVQFGALFRKFNLAYWRSPGYNFSRLSITLLVSILYGTTYYKRGKIDNPSSTGNIQNVMGIMFSSSNFLGMTNLMSAMAVIGYERIVFYREQGASMYDAFAYGFAIALVEMPYLLIQTLMFVPIMYWMVSFKATAEAFFQYLIIFLETITFYTIFGQFLIYITPNQAVAQVIGAMFNFLFNIFNGFVITYPAMPKGWRWMNRFSPPTWILYGLGIMQLGDSQNLVSLPTTNSSSLPTVAEFMPVYFGYDYSMRWWCALILLAYILFVRITSILALKYINFYRR